MYAYDSGCSYEYGTGGASINRTNFRETELASLDDYRLRYNQYRTDVSLCISLVTSLWGEAYLTDIIST